MVGMLNSSENHISGVMVGMLTACQPLHP
jgi:hypothetical protein